LIGRSLIDLIRNKTGKLRLVGQIHSFVTKRFRNTLGEELNKTAFKLSCQIQHNDAIGYDVELVTRPLTSDFGSSPAMMNIDVLHAQIVRSNTALPWGLHLHGGGGQPLIIAQVSFTNSTFQF
jgi:hypothetical protein